MLKRRSLFLLTSLVLGLLMSGCGGSGKLQIHGRVLKDGAPYLPPESDVVRVMFVPIGPEKVTDYYAATFHPEDGTFVAMGQGVPPGRYRISIEHLHGRTDLLKKRGDPEHSPFECEVKSAADEVTIDLANLK